MVRSSKYGCFQRGCAVVNEMKGRWNKLIYNYLRVSLSGDEFYEVTKQGVHDYEITSGAMSTEKEMCHDKALIWKGVCAYEYVGISEAFDGCCLRECLDLPIVCLGCLNSSDLDDYSLLCLKDVTEKEVSFGHVKSDIWKWPKRKKMGGTQCKVSLSWHSMSCSCVRPWQKKTACLCKALLFFTKKGNVVANMLCSKGPSPTSRRFNGYYVKGYRFHTKARDDRCKTQNSGVSLTALSPSFASSRDKNPVLGNVEYYGRVLEIIELDYWSKFKVVLFRCEWYQVEKDELGLSCVNFNKLCCSNDPFVMPSQVHQVFYVPDPIQNSLHYVVNKVPRDLFDFEEECMGNKSKPDQGEITAISEINATSSHDHNGETGEDYPQEVSASVGAPKKKVAEKAKANWAKKKMVQVTAKKTYARVREELKKVAEKAKANWAKKKMVQVTAKKTYARVREELKKSLTGSELTRKELFRVCFSKYT
ncbi:hypothetical protein CTI12_AA411890 [Artemisia annua]|uniref:DUF4216 domain-containing protein n=1 Tax=Artemisia annua TaxID=35608 RepID=A0A2U1M7S7_ARTAN|nr:hypothetical protein CTI12_AA411890 [Artemisia annua]